MPSDQLFKRALAAPATRQIRKKQCPRPVRHRPVEVHQLPAALYEPLNTDSACLVLDGTVRGCAV